MGVLRETCVDRWGVWLANKRTGTPKPPPLWISEQYHQAFLFFYKIKLLFPFLHRCHS